ncbi:tRNA (32-2'-O)-methyltransferase regulator THADA-like isoform X2 [Ambystoma mexicanum]|uniref:tRNA (32-2'-O)-methyltransferase regulator THADA-like isoform X2 n=1 Tax=Ambystoma mexicanum TaxID=8296 RepID=UPI0037E944F2
MKATSAWHCPGPGAIVMQDSPAQYQAKACLLFYQDPERAPLGATREHLTAVAQKLCHSAGASVKRCKDRILDEALELLQKAIPSLAGLDDCDVLPLVSCLLLMQMESANSSGTFAKLEKIISHFNKAKESVVSAEVNRLMSSMLADQEVLMVDHLQAVSMFLGESCAGRQYWRQNFLLLLRQVSVSLERVLDNETASCSEWGYVTVKMCLQMFQGMPEKISQLVWRKTENGAVLQRILASLVQVIMTETVSRDTRLLAGTAISMLANTALEPKLGATAMQNLFQRMEAGVWRLEFGELTAAVSTRYPDGLEKLALTWGLLSCGRNEVLSCNLTSSDSQVCLLIEVVFPTMITLFKENTKWHYHCFQVFALWLQRIQDNAPGISQIRETRLFHQNCELLQNVTHLLWANAEKPTYCLECDRFGDTERPVYKEFLLRIAAVPWQVKARYVPLCALLPYAGPGMVLEVYRELPQHILSCLSTNYLSPMASDVYKTILQLQHRSWAEEAAKPSDLELAQKWARCWLPVLSRALTSSAPLLQRNASNYLLGQTLSTFPASYDLLARDFQGPGSTSLRAWITLLSVVKMTTGAMPSNEDDLGRLGLCIHSADEAVRLAAMGLLCCSPRTTQPLSETEIRLLEECLPQSMNSDSSGFRQLLQASVKKVLVRMRDSGLANLRSYKGKMSKGRMASTDGTFFQGIEFVEWLMKLIVCSLRPGSNFQRRKTALLLLSAVLETCTDSWSPERKKGQPPQNIADLVNFAQQRGCWDFFSQTNMLALMSCLADNTNEIRELATELLLQYFASSLPDSLTMALFQHAQEMMCSPRVQEAEAGAGMMKTAMQRSDSSTMRKLFPEEKDSLALQSAGLCYVRHLLRMLEDHFTAAQQDLLQAAATKPMQGVIVAVRQCLLEVPPMMTHLQKSEFHQHWKELVQNLVTTLRDVGIFILRVLYGRREATNEQPAAAPSFADMGQAISSLIQQGRGLEQPQEADEEEGLVLLSREHSLILTCCWVSIKEVGLLLGSLVQKTLSLVPPAGDESLLSVEVLETVAGLFRNILLQCRHWGAVEGCSLGFTRFCCSLLSHQDPALRLIPRRMLTEALDLLQEHRPSSITRRAAGFPMLLLGIVVGEDHTTSRPLLAHCINTSLTLARRPLPPDWDETVDLPQVSAIHVLQTLVRSSGLGGALLPFLTSMVVLSLKALVSPCWAMRNAAVQLFSALTARTLGQKRSWGETCAQNAVTPQVFFTQYPELREILLQELLCALDTSTSLPGGRVRLCHSLHSTLTLLSHLQPGNDGLGSSSSCFVEPLHQLSGNPIFAVREMAAQALVPAVPVVEYGSLLLRLVEELASGAGAISHNALHGRLLQIQALLAQALATDSLSEAAVLSVAHGLESSFWLVTPAQHCLLIRSAYLGVVSLLMHSFPPDFLQQVEEAVGAELSHTPSEVQVGLTAFRQTGARYLCTVAAVSSNAVRHAQVCSLLQDAEPDVQMSILAWVTEQDGGGMDTALVEAMRRTLQEAFGQVLLPERSREFFKLFLQAYVFLHQQPPPSEQSCSHESLGETTLCASILFDSMDAGAAGPDLLGIELCVASLLIVQSCRSALEEPTLLNRWCQTLTTFSDPVSSEVLRLAAARALKLAGVDIVRRALTTALPLQSWAVKVIAVGLHLLQDEDQTVRQEAEGFASLVWCSVQPGMLTIKIHSNKGLMCLLQLLLDRFWSCRETFPTLLLHLPSADLGEVMEELQADRATSLYEQDEPNVYAEPAVFSRLLLPFLLQLLEKMAESPRHLQNIECWARESIKPVVSGLQYCQQWWSQDVTFGPYFIKALGSPKVHSALAVLLTKAELLVHTLKVLNDAKAVSSVYTSLEISQQLAAVQQLLARNGMISPCSKFS